MSTYIIALVCLVLMALFLAWVNKRAQSLAEAIQDEFKQEIPLRRHHHMMGSYPGNANVAISRNIEISMVDNAFYNNDSVGGIAALPLELPPLLQIHGLLPHECKKTLRFSLLWEPAFYTDKGKCGFDLAVARMCVGSVSDRRGDLPEMTTHCEHNFMSRDRLESVLEFDVTDWNMGEVFAYSLGRKSFEGSTVGPLVLVDIRACVAFQINTEEEV